MDHFVYRISILILIGSPSAVVLTQLEEGHQVQNMIASSLASTNRLSAEPVCGACPADCLDACFNEAIVLVVGEGVRVQADSCAGCGACIPVCEFGFIRLHDGIARVVFPEGKPQHRNPGPPLAP